MVHLPNSTSETIQKAMTTEGHPDLQPSRFPQDPSEFDADHRISFSKLDNKFILETDEGQEYGYDDALKRWIPSV